MDLDIDRSDVSSTSIRLAVKLAIYSTPRRSSSAISEAYPPIGTTRPNAPAQAAVVSAMARTLAPSARYPKRLVIKYTLAILASLCRRLNGDRGGRPALADDQRYG